jgi:TatA/E family protein of Tat protein translocase
VNIGPMEIAIVLILALLVFGPKRLPQAGRSLGQALRELKKATSSARSELGLDDVAADVKDLKSSLTIDLKATDAPAPPRPVDSPAGMAAATTAAVVDVLPAAAAPPEAEAATAEAPDETEPATPDAAELVAPEETEPVAPDTAAAPVKALEAVVGPEAEATLATETAPPEPEDASTTPSGQSAL